MIAVILSLVAVVAVWYIHSLLQRQKHFQRRGVTVPPHWPVFGNMYELFFKNHKWKVHDEWYKKYKHKKVFGVYELAKPNLFLTDPELAKAVMVKDADHFVDRRHTPLNKTGQLGDIIFSEMLSMQRGEKWKFLRNAMSPTFSSGKMKAMFPLICSAAENTVSYFENKTIKEGSVRSEVGLSKYTVAVIASCVFGIHIPIEDSLSDFEKAAQKLLGFSAGDMLRGVVIMVLPKFMLQLLNFQFAKPEFMHFIDLAKGTMAERKKAGVRREDFVDLIMDLQKDSKPTDSSHLEITENVALAQLTLFLFAGFDTTTNSASFTTYLLAENQHVQDKLREELREVYSRDGGFTYENIGECTYLSATLNESLRLYGIGFFLERECTKEYTLPGLDVTVKPGELVTIPNWSFSRDPDIWEDPEEFQPERFLPENKDKLPAYGSLPFGAGPRSCIAMRFAQLEAKVLLAYLVLNHRMTLAPGKEELILDSGSMNFRAVEHGIHLVYEKI